ncbi:MAG TPA: hypothetical protein PLD47_10595 [Aggregatilineales bacterium]|nr:hypothetical protein [Anaerolineales bacterium]HRE48163.1 hypothetical protein [Aggregatilineales bacterium]
MIKRLISGIDKSPRLAAILKWFRTTLPARRGLMLFVAMGVIFLSLIVHILWVISGSVFLAICGFVLLHFAVIGGFFGILLGEALGRGYRE